MAFTLNTFQYGRGVTSSYVNGNGVSTVIHGYKTDDTFSTVDDANYFPATLADDNIYVGDLMSIVTSDTVAMCLITSLDPFTIGADLYGGAGNPIVAAAPIAATDANGLKVTGSTVQLEIADATHPGIVTELDQAFAGIKSFGSGVKFLSFGGTPTTLNHYEELTHSTTFTNSAEVTAAQSIKLIRIGSEVNLMFPASVSTPGQGAPGVAFISNTALPARFRPLVEVVGFAQVSNGGVYKAGLVKVKTTGVIEVYNDADLTSIYTIAQINAFYSAPITYSIL